MHSTVFSRLNASESMNFLHAEGALFVKKEDGSMVGRREGRGEGPERWEEGARKKKGGISSKFCYSQRKS